jgi:hypothetical protein
LLGLIELGGFFGTEEALDLRSVEVVDILVDVRDGVGQQRLFGPFLRREEFVEAKKTRNDIF